ncbi:MAG: hypothetical protein CMJ19_00820 [Phycisphaeraceae bacterium]|nr:hypothetical protein [Phycisphaeraceae bacterium]
MNSMITTVWLALLVLLGAWCSYRKCRQIHPRYKVDEDDAYHAMTDRLFIVLTLGAIALFLFRVIAIHQSWRPLTAHVDGLTLLAGLLCPTLMYLEKRGKARGLSYIGYPGVTFVLLWALCASRWSFRAFTPGDVMKVVHLFAVYLGALSVFIAAIYGGTYLTVQRRLKNKTDLGQAKKFASLETLERMIVISSAVGFAFISLGLVTGLISISSLHEQRPGGWWYEPKIILSFCVWLIYALLFNVRHTTFFRGNRAAWLSLLGLFLLLMTFAMAHTFTDSVEHSQTPVQSAAQDREADG